MKSEINHSEEVKIALQSEPGSPPSTRISAISEPESAQNAITRPSAIPKKVAVPVGNPSAADADGEAPQPSAPEEAPGHSAQLTKAGAADETQPAAPVVLETPEPQETGTADGNEPEDDQAGEQTSQMTEEEIDAEVEAQEKRILKSQQSEFLTIGGALNRIRQIGERYVCKKFKVKSFEVYIRQRFDISKSHAYRMMDAARLFDLLEGHEKSPTGDALFLLPVNERQARALVKVYTAYREEGDERVREKVVEVFTHLPRTRKRFKRDEITSAKIRQAVNRVLEADGKADTPGKARPQTPRPAESIEELAEYVQKSLLHLCEEQQNPSGDGPRDVNEVLEEFWELAKRGLNTEEPVEDEKMRESFGDIKPDGPEETDGEGSSAQSPDHAETAEGNEPAVNQRPADQSGDDETGDDETGADEPGADEPGANQPPDNEPGSENSSPDVSKPELQPENDKDDDPQEG